MIYHYYCNCWEKPDPHGDEHLYDIESGKIDEDDEWEWERLVEECAEDYLSNHDGWEHTSWTNDPMEFWIYDENKKFIAKFDVYLEYNPSFSATRVNG